MNRKVHSVYYTHTNQICKTELGNKLKKEEERI